MHCSESLRPRAKDDAAHLCCASRAFRDFANEFAKSQSELVPYGLNSIACVLERLVLLLTLSEEAATMNQSIVLKKTLGLIVLILTVVASATTAFAQEVEQRSQISIQGTALVTKNSKDQIPSNEATKSGGLLLGYSYQFSRWFGSEANYGYTRNTQNFITLGGPSSLQLVAHIPMNVRNFRPYLLGGGGALVFDPTDKFIVTGADQQTRGAFVYGGGANFDITSSFGVRAEYRGLVYKVPDFGLSQLNLDKFTHLAQPSVGFFFRF